MIVSSVHKVQAEDVDHFFELATSWLTALANLPGWISGSVGRSVDEVDHWLILQQWQDVGSCRRGLSTSDLRPIAFELAKSNVSSVSTFETLLQVTSDQVTKFDSVRSVDADTFSLADNKSSDEV